MPRKIRVQRTLETQHEWEVWVTEDTEVGEVEQLSYWVDDCDTEEQALKAAEELIRHNEEVL